MVAEEAFELCVDKVEGLVLVEEVAQEIALVVGSVNTEEICTVSAEV